MRKEILYKVKRILTDKHKRRRWLRLVSAMMAMVVFCTTYALILPAITMERVAYCGIEGHTHTEECYEKPTDADISTSGAMLSADDETEDEPSALTFAYSDNEISGIITLDWSDKLPGDLECTVVRLDESDEGYGKMLKAVALTMENTSQIISREQLYRLEWTSNGSSYTLPSELTPIVQFTVLDSGSINIEETQLAGATLTEKGDGRIFKSVSGLDRCEALGLSLYSVEDDSTSASAFDADIEDEYATDYTDITYEAETVFAENDGLELKLSGASVFAVLRTESDVSVDGDYYVQVDSIDEIADAKRYLLMFANGTAGLSCGETDTDFTAKKLEIYPVKDKENSAYFSFVDVEEADEAVNPSNTPQLNWRIYKQSESEDTYTLINTDTLSAISCTLTHKDSENCWLISTEGAQYLSYSYDTDKVSCLTTANKGTVNMLIFKYVGSSGELVDDIADSNALVVEDTPSMTKPDYDTYVPVSDAKQETAVLDEQHSLAGATLACSSDEATSQIESVLGMVKSSLTEEEQLAEQRKNDGRLVTDKSVIYGKDDYSAIGEENYAEGDFSVTLSALGQEWAVDEGVDDEVPIDVVFIYDLSDSMKKSATSGSTQTRWMASADAINDAMYEIMEVNPLNRVGVVEFSNDSGELIELGRYKADNNEYFTYSTTGSLLYNTLKVADSLVYEDSDEVSPDAGKYLYQAISGAYAQTYTQRGLQEAYEMFARNTDTTITIDGIDEPVKRQPVIILVTDGDPTLCSYNYMNPKAGPNYGLGYTFGIEGYYTILSANYFKNLTGLHYGKRAAFYTIGMGIYPEGYGNYEKPSLGYDDSYRRAVLNPTAENIAALDDYDVYSTSNGGKALLSYYWKDSSVVLKRLLTETCMDSTDTYYIKNSEFVDNVNMYYRSNYSASKGYYTKTERSNSLTGLGYTSASIRGMDNPYKDNYAYADGAYFGNLDTEDLDAIFEEILSKVQVMASYDFSLKDNSSVTFTDVIGEGMTVKGTPVLRYYGVNYTEPEQSEYEDEENTYVVYRWNVEAVRQSSDTKEDEPTVDLSKITLTVATDRATGVQTVTFDIPEEAVPTLYPDKHDSFYYEELPVRAVYRVGLSAEEEERLKQQAGAVKDKSYYTNQFSDATAGTTVTFTPIADNPYYTADTSSALTKSQNVSSTAACYFTEAVNADGSVTQRLGNNGRLILNKPETVNITVQKVWEGTKGDKAEVELYRTGTMLDSNAEERDFVELADTITLTEANNWSCSLIGLPKEKTVGTVTYTYTNYYIREVPMQGYAATYTDADGNEVDTQKIKLSNAEGNTEIEAVAANAGTVVIVNADSYALPESGGIGVIKFTAGGLLTMLAVLLACLKLHKAT